MLLFKKTLTNSVFIFTFIHLANAFIQSDVHMRTIEANKPTIGQQYASAMTLPSLI